MRATSPSPRASVSVPGVNVAIPPAAAQEPSLEQQLDAWVNEPLDMVWDDEYRTHREERGAREACQALILDWQRENAGRPAERTGVLILSNLNLSCLPAAIGLLENLLRLDASSNSLTHLPPEIGQLQHLEILNLENNEIRQLPAEIGRLQNLESLRMDRNSLTDLPLQFASLRSLLSFSADRNPLGRVPEPIGRLLTLRLLTLTNCGLTELPDAIVGLQDLIYLYLGGNSLANLPDGIGRLANLRGLLLEGNRLANIPASIGQLENLDNLWLDRNVQLTHLPEAVVAMSRWCEVSVEDCPALPQAVHTALGAVREPDRDLAAERDFLLTQEQRAAFSTDGGEPIEFAASFFDWLGRMRETSDYGNHATRAGVEARLTQLIDDMRGDIQLRRTCFEIAFEALRECDDRVAVGFNQMHAVAMTARTLRPGIDEKSLIGIGIDMFVLDLVEKEARAKIVQLRAMAGRPGDEIETMLFFQTALRAPLAQVGINVPLPAQTMRHRGAAGVSDQELGVAAQRIRAVYQDGISMPRFLVRWAPLSKYIETSFAEQFTEVEAGFRARLEELEEQNEQDAISGSDYLTRSNELMKGLADAHEQLRQRLISDVLKRNLAPASA